ncbi:MAG: hypothetical protein JO255_14935 [Alphaproteobacteria bacterium]|nr:hypothetical protein [Alphaproteobacteria bacterium]
MTGGRDSRSRRLARLLIGRHGEEATARAAERAAERLNRKCYSGAAFWAVVADLAHRMNTEGFRVVPEKREPSAKQILGGEVTKAVMEADKVDRSEVEALLGEVAEKPSPN